MKLQTFKSFFILKLCLLSNFVDEFNTRIFKAMMTGAIEMFVNKVVPLLIAFGKFHVGFKTALMIFES